MTYFNYIYSKLIKGVFALLVLMVNTALAMPPADPMLGFTDNNQTKEYMLENEFDGFLSINAMRVRLIKMSSAPNYAGSPHNKENAEDTLKLFRSWGWDAHIEIFHALIPTPQIQILETIEPTPYHATFSEPTLEEDATTMNTENMLPAYLAYGADGDVEAELVYVNYGMPEDYETLSQLGVSVDGKIVIVRYGAGWRGLKPKLAYEHGAIGCIIYSDPINDGYGQGDVYPKGAWRPEKAIQRGAIIDLPIAPGDPLTPNVGATEDAKRLPLEQAETILKIPAVAISYGDAQHFLSLIDGQAVPESWRGGLPMTYHVGPSTTKVHLKVKYNWNLAPLYNVIATMKGEEFPDQWVLRGNNRDAWVYGAWVPLAAHSAMLEEAKGLGMLYQTGWRPKRTIVYASWDAEEMGLIGSTEWVETHSAELKEKAVLYINSGVNGRGFLEVGASQPTRRLVDQVASDVNDPQTNVSVKARAAAARQVQGFMDGTLSDNASLAQQQDFAIGDLGAGSDYTPFLQHLGIMSIDLGFGGEEEQYGSYHSAYDTFEHFERFGDPDMTYNLALAKTAGRLVLRTANADIIPFQFSPFASRLKTYVDEIEETLSAMRTQTKIHNDLVENNAFSLAADPNKYRPSLMLKDPVPEMDFSSLNDVISRLTIASNNYDAALANNPNLSQQVRRELNAMLQNIEQNLIDQTGLPNRSWYKHMVYAPGMLTGYEVKTLPGIREAVEGRRWLEADEYNKRTTLVLENFLLHLESALTLLN